MWGQFVLSSLASNLIKKLELDINQINLLGSVSLFIQNHLVHELHCGLHAALRLHLRDLAGVVDSLPWLADLENREVRSACLQFILNRIEIQRMVVGSSDRICFQVCVCVCVCLCT